MCFGGSTTFGMTVEPTDKPYPDVLEDVLTGTRPGLSDVRVINAGVPGVHVGYCLDKLTEWNREVPRVIVFCEAINWLDRSIRGHVTARNSYLASVGDSLWTRHRANWNVDRYTGRAYDTRLRKFVAAVEALPAQLVLMTFAMPYTSQANRDTLRYYDVMQNGQSSAYAAARLVEVHNEILRDICREKNIPCVDLARELTGQEDLFIDNCHFTQEGRQRVARLCAPAIAHLLDADASPPVEVVDGFDSEKLTAIP